MEIVELCKKYRREGVVAIDLAGDESLSSETNPDHRRAFEVGGEPGGSLMASVSKALMMDCPAL